MPAAHRYQDWGSGHGCWPMRPNVGGSPTVFVNTKPWHRETDPWPVHICVVIPFPAHASSMKSGSPTVYADGLQVARVGDPVLCGSNAATGSGNVFAG